MFRRLHSRTQGGSASLVVPLSGLISADRSEPRTIARSSKTEASLAQRERRRRRSGCSRSTRMAVATVARLVSFAWAIAAKLVGASSVDVSAGKDAAGKTLWLIQPSRMESSTSSANGVDR